MKKIFTLIAAICLFTSISAFAQTTMVTMKTAQSTVNLTIYWFGTGTVTANGTPLSVNVKSTITVQSGTVNVVTTGDVQLTEITCSQSGLTSLDVSKCVDLTSLECRANQLKTLDITNSKKIITINCGNNLLTSLNLSNSDALEYLYVNDNQFTSLDLSVSKKLKIIDCGSNLFTNFDFTNFPLLEYIYFTNHKLTSINVSNCPILKFFNCNIGTLKTLDLSAIPSLEKIMCWENLLTNLKLPQTLKLTYLTCRNNQLKSIDISSCIELQTLNCDENQLTNLDVSKCTKLTSLSAIGQKVTLAQATATNGALSVNNPVYFNNAVVTSITPSNGGTYASSKVSWNNLTGASGNETFSFSANSGNFTGTITQPWVASQSTPVDEHENEGITILSNKSSIVIEGVKANQMIWVYNITGKLFYQSPASSSSAVIDVPAGIYVVKIDNQTFKIIRY